MPNKRKELVASGPGGPGGLSTDAIEKDAELARMLGQDLNLDAPRPRASSSLRLTSMSSPILFSVSDTGLCPLCHLSKPLKGFRMHMDNCWKCPVCMAVVQRVTLESHLTYCHQQFDPQHYDQAQAMLCVCRYRKSVTVPSVPSAPSVPSVPPPSPVIQTPLPYSTASTIPHTRKKPKRKKEKRRMK